MTESDRTVPSIDPERRLAYRTTGFEGRWSWATRPTLLAMQRRVQATELDQRADGRVDGRYPQLQPPTPSPHLQPREAVNHKQPFTGRRGQTARHPHVTGWAAHLRNTCHGAKFAHACSDG